MPCWTGRGGICVRLRSKRAAGPPSRGLFSSRLSSPTRQAALVRTVPLLRRPYRGASAATGCCRRAARGPVLPTTGFVNPAAGSDRSDAILANAPRTTNDPPGSLSGRVLRSANRFPHLRSQLATQGRRRCDTGNLTATGPAGAPWRAGTAADRPKHSSGPARRFARRTAAGEGARPSLPCSPGNSHTRAAPGNNAPSGSAAARPNAPVVSAAAPFPFQGGSVGIFPGMEPGNSSRGNSRRRQLAKG